MKNNKQRGVGVPERLLILAITGLVIFIGGYAWHTHKTSKNQITTAVSEVYKRTTTVPAGWKVYTSSLYRFGFSYPPDWVIDSGAGALAESVLAKNKQDFQVLFGPPDQQGYSYDLTVSHETLDQAVASLEQTIQASRSSGTSLKIISKKYYKIDGHDAVRIDTQVSDSLSPKVGAIEFLIAANNLVYKFGTNFSDVSTSLLGSPPLLTLFESLKLD